MEFMLIIMLHLESYKVEKYNYVDNNSSKRYNKTKDKREINKK